MSLFEQIVTKNEEVVDRIRNQVFGTVIISKNGIPIQTSFDNTTTQGFINLVAGTLVEMARSCVRDIDAEDDLQFLRIQTKNMEIMVGPDEDFTIIVAQN